jgi:hypothetical protein
MKFIEPYSVYSQAYKENVECFDGDGPPSTTSNKYLELALIHPNPNLKNQKEFRKNQSINQSINQFKFKFNQQDPFFFNSFLIVDMKSLVRPSPTWN